jgi:cell division protein FtsB
MRMRHRITTSANLLIVPAICCTITAYFGYAGIVGPRGLIAWSDTEAQLSMSRRELAELRDERTALQRRISLLDEDALDPDLLEEVARATFAQGRPGEVAIPRVKQ